MASELFLILNKPSSLSVLRIHGSKNKIHGGDTCAARLDVMTLRGSAPAFGDAQLRTPA